VKLRPALLALAIVGSLVLAACKRDATPSPAASGVAPAAAGETADQFIARVNDEFRKSYSELTSAQWLSSTYINSDTEKLAAKANERWLSQLNGWIEQSKRFEGQRLSPRTARAIRLLKLMTAMPAPKESEEAAGTDPDRHPHGRHVRLGQLLHRMKATPRSAATSAS
jgi:peptidyl-dipeptidase A